MLLASAFGRGNKKRIARPFNSSSKVCSQRTRRVKNRIWAFALLALAIFGTISEVARGQVMPFKANISAEGVSALPRQVASSYTRPTQKLVADNYLFATFGPYPISGAAVAAGVGQWNNSPPEWGQGAQGYGKRIGSDFGMAAIGTTVRYGLSEAFREDSLYYRCECRGVFPRIGNAVISTVTARRGQNGHRVFSFSALAAPYAGAAVAVYGWYPDRYGAKDALRLGSYNLLFYVGGNISLEFLYSRPRSLMSRMHLNNTHGSPDPGPNH